MPDVRSFIAKMEKSYGAKLQPRHRKFLESKEGDTLGDLKLVKGFVRGTFTLDFTDDDLADLSALGEDFGIDDMDDVDWPGEFGEWVPFATMQDAHDEDGEDPVKSFLIVSVQDPACPVLVWNYDGWMVYPLAKSLDDFVDGVAKAESLEHDRAGHPYQKFAWVEDDEDEDDDDDDDDD